MKRISFLIAFICLTCLAGWFGFAFQKKSLPETEKPIHIFFEGLATQPAFLGMIDLVQLPKDELKIFAWHRFTDRAKLMDLTQLNAIEVPVEGREGSCIINAGLILKKVKEVLDQNPKAPLVVWTNVNNVNYFLDVLFKEVDFKRVQHIHLYEDGLGEMYTWPKVFKDFSFTQQDLQNMKDYWFDYAYETPFPSNGKYMVHHFFPVTYHFYGLKKLQKDPEYSAFFKKMKGAKFEEIDFLKLNKTLSQEEKKNLSQLLNFDMEKYQKIFKENKTFMFVGGNYPTYLHDLHYAEIAYLKKMVQEKPDYYFLLKEHPSLETYKKNKFLEKDIPELDILNPQLPYEIFIIMGIEPNKVAGRLSSLFYTLSNDKIEGYFRSQNYMNGLKKYINLDEKKEINGSLLLPEKPYFYDAEINRDGAKDYVIFLNEREVYLYQIHQVFSAFWANNSLALKDKDTMEFYEKDENNVYQKINKPNVFQVVHPYWKDIISLKEKDVFCRSKGDCGRLKRKTNGFEICWENWGCESYSLKTDGQYYLDE